MAPITGCAILSQKARASAYRVLVRFDCEKSRLTYLLPCACDLLAHN